LNTAPTEGKRPALIAIHLAALGVVFGDIGTSPLYTIRECFHDAVGLAPTPENVVGVLSLVFWAITLVVMVKYVTFVLRADNKGEGGVLALAAIALKHSSGGKFGPALIFAGMLGAALFYSDGILTPAISVLGATEGLLYISPAFDGWSMPLSIVLLLILFLAQKRGTAGIGALFGPVIVVWFAVLAALGIYGITMHPGVLAALNPLPGIELLLSGHARTLVLLGAVVLAVTGAEALYADMGHFGRDTIRRVWTFFVWPALILNYFGQGALLLEDAAAVANPFYLLAPELLRIPLVILATMAAIIASQAVISGAFSVTSQAVELGWLPRIRILHTSARHYGQIYVPQVNIALMVAVVLTVFGFKTSSNLASAYGVAVTGQMILSTLLAFYFFRVIKRWHLLPLLLAGLFFLVIDIGFFTSNMVKIVQGGWMPVSVGIVLVLVMDTWRRGRKLLAERFLDGALPLETLLKQAEGQKIHRVKGVAVFMTSNLNVVPTALLHNLKHNQVLHKRVVLLRVNTLEDTPRVPLDEQLHIETLTSGFARIEIRHGFMQSIDVPEVLERCRTFGLEFPPMETSYFVSRQALVHEHSSKMSAWRSRLFIVMMDYALGPTEYFRLPPNRVVELGTKTDV